MGWEKWERGWNGMEWTGLKGKVGFVSVVAMVFSRRFDMWTVDFVLIIGFRAVE